MVRLNVISKQENRILAAICSSWNHRGKCSISSFVCQLFHPFSIMSADRSKRHNPLANSLLQSIFGFPNLADCFAPSHGNQVLMGQTMAPDFHINPSHFSQMSNGCMSREANIL